MEGLGYTVSILPNTSVICYMLYVIRIYNLHRHTYIHTYIHTYTHTYIHTYIHTYLQLQETLRHCLVITWAFPYLALNAINLHIAPIAIDFFMFL